MAERVFDQNVFTGEVYAEDGQPVSKAEARSWLDRQNASKARRAFDILRAYAWAHDRGSDVETAAYDLLTDLMHWGDRRRRHGKYDKFEIALETARGHFAVESGRGGVD